VWCLWNHKNSNSLVFVFLLNINNIKLDWWQYPEQPSCRDTTPVVIWDNSMSSCLSYMEFPSPEWHNHYWDALQVTSIASIIKREILKGQPITLHLLEIHWSDDSSDLSENVLANFSCQAIVVNSALFMTQLFTNDGQLYQKIAIWFRKLLHKTIRKLLHKTKAYY
jgi:hypothetical protein